jgi:hypothetical protein
VLLDVVRGKGHQRAKLERRNRFWVLIMINTRCCDSLLRPIAYVHDGTRLEPSLQTQTPLWSFWAHLPSSPCTFSDRLYLSLLRCLWSAMGIPFTLLTCS